MAGKVTVTAEGATVRTASSERSGLVTGKQVDSLAIKGRNISSLLGLLPGVVDRGDAEALSRGADIIVQGGRKDTNSIVLDGAPSHVGWIVKACASCIVELLYIPAESVRAVRAGIFLVMLDKA